MRAYDLSAQASGLHVRHLDLDVGVSQDIDIPVQGSTRLHHILMVLD